jgi:hypothetical protein
VSQSNVITIDNVTVCASGENLIVYDIGTMDSQGVFSVLVSSAYSTQISVQTGQAACFRLVMQYARLERSYTRIVSDIIVQLFDLGRNVSFVLCRLVAVLCVFLRMIHSDGPRQWHHIIMVEVLQRQNISTTSNSSSF